MGAGVDRLESAKEGAYQYLREDIKKAILERKEAYQTCDVLQQEIDLLRRTLEESKGHHNNESPHSSSDEGSVKENKLAERMAAKRISL